MEDWLFIICFAIALVFLFVFVFSVRLRGRIVLEVRRWVGRMKTRNVGGGDGKEDGAGASSAGGGEVDYSGMKTRDLLVAVLRQMNCQVEDDDEDADRMYFTFQGENFCATASNDCLMVTIYDFSWGNVPLDDIDEVSNLRKAINTTNLYTGLTVAYTISSEHKRMVVHTKRQILLTPCIHSIETYMQAMLGGFFEVHRVLNRELDKLRGGKAE